MCRLYATPFVFLYLLFAYAYLFRYETWVRSEEWTFIYAVSLILTHALSYLATQWSVRIRAALNGSPVPLEQADSVLLLPHPHRGDGGIVALERHGKKPDYSFIYQADRYVLMHPNAKADVADVYSSADIHERTFRRLPYPADAHLPLERFQKSKGLSGAELDHARTIYGENRLHIPQPTFGELFAEHAVAPFFVFQIFCVGLWLLDEYWMSSLFTLFGLVAFECTVVFQRQRSLAEFRTMSIQPFDVLALRNGKWTEVSSSELVPGDVISVTRTRDDSALPCDVLITGGSAIVNEAMLSGESTPLLKEGLEQRNGTDRLDDQGDDRLHVLFGGTKTLQVTPPSTGAAPDGGAVGVVLRTGFGTTQGRLVRLMVFTNENRVTANNVESFIFIGFLLIFALISSAYVWNRGLQMGRPKGKLLLDCILIITSVVPPELPMELSMAVNASLVALSKRAIFCTEPFRIPYSGRVDVCCFDKTGTITGEDLEVQGIAEKSTDLTPVTGAAPETSLVLASANALVLIDGDVVGDPMELRAVEAAGWEVRRGDNLVPKSTEVASSSGARNIHIRSRFHFSSSLKRMSAVADVTRTDGKNALLASVKGAPETLRSMYRQLPDNYDSLYRYYTRRGSRVIALGYRWLERVDRSAVKSLHREDVECDLEFAGFLVLHCPLKPDAIEALRQLGDSAHRCIMITGDNPLTAVHVAEQVDIVNRETLILDRRAGRDEHELVWRSTDDSTVIDQDANGELHRRVFDEYDVCVTGAALRVYEEQPEKLKELVQNTVVYARVSPAQKELILITLRGLGYITLMAGDGTNDVGALKAADIGVALLDGTEEDLRKIAEHQRNERMKRAYEAQLNISMRLSQPPPPVPPALREAYPQLEEARQKAATQMLQQRRANPSAKFDLGSITETMSQMEDDEGPPQIRLGDASVAAPFTSKLSNVSSICAIIRQGRCTLVATIQMYKILALNCLIQAYSLSVLYLDGIKFYDYQLTVTGILVSVCFYCISRGQPIEKLSRERPVSNIVNVYVFGSILSQTALHIATMYYIQRKTIEIEPLGEIDLEAKFTPNLLNTGVFLLSLSQTVSTFSVNYIGRPWRESIPENKSLYWGLLTATAIAYLGVAQIEPQLNSWLKLVHLDSAYQYRLAATMIVDMIGST
ncbi:putative cation-transporting ATPase 1 [Malassezia cuniculi]|uniref:Cation-transporting ATPase 1 n=1 Tax=Malassezia cuniculi TaxID=948313 RepID=A0AAF0ET22_9BASI|nr:putative cation-transporting ATPase 1 [Malassezia cuniculi]